MLFYIDALYDVYVQKSHVYPNRGTMRTTHYDERNKHTGGEIVYQNQRLCGDNNNS